jgi:methylated-DNA-[protein]-cysteine S-methyltransferase
VALANGANPVGVVVPCHRVIGANGSLTGYAGGLARKRWLLVHEGALSGDSQEKSGAKQSRCLEC